MVRPAGLIAAVLLLALATQSPEALGAAGTLDPKFSSDGRQITDLVSRNEDNASAVAVQLDGRIVVVGTTRVNDHSEVSIARYRPDGSLDKTGGGDGKLTFGFEGDPSLLINDVAIQPDGKILVAGAIESDSVADAIRHDFLVMRFLTDGALDPTFGGDGSGVALLDAGADDVASAVEVLADGRILVAGNSGKYVAGPSCGFFECDVEGFEEHVVMRLDAGGATDASFGNGGATRVPAVSPNGGNVSDMALAPDGGIALGGDDAKKKGERQFLAIRLTADGARDTAFSGDGLALTDPTKKSVVDPGTAVAVESNGRTVMAGIVNDDGDATNAQFAVVRHRSDGTLDKSFAGRGIALTDFGRASSDGDLEGARAVTIQPDGKILAVGTAIRGFAVARYTRAGKLDRTFSGDGKVVTRFAKGSQATAEDAIVTNGRLVAAGTLLRSSGYDFAIARYRLK